MDYRIFHGELVRLAALDSESSALELARWMGDTEFSRLLDAVPAERPSVHRMQQSIQELQQEQPQIYPFAIRTLQEDRLIGRCELEITVWANREAFVGIGIGERDYWGRGYGTDAMHILLRYAFTELNLHRVSLNVFSYNERAIHCYEKIGFQHEGRLNRWVHREGRRWDLVYMGILSAEWQALQQACQRC